MIPAVIVFAYLALVLYVGFVIANGTATDITIAIVRIIPRAVCVKFMSFSSFPDIGEVPLRWAGPPKSEAAIGTHGCGPRSRGCDDLAVS